MKVSWACFISLFCLMAACQAGKVDSKALTAAETAALPAGDCWPFRPQRIIVHPMSYFPMHAKGVAPTVAVYIECLDPDNQSTRTVGVLRVVAQVPAISITSSMKYDLGDKAENNRVWDSVSRCYLVNLPLPEGFHCAPEALLSIHATLNLDSDEQLTTQGAVNCPHRSP